MEFIKYPSLTLVQNINRVPRVRQELSSENLWYATEKLHGENAGIVIKDNMVRYASRTQWVDTEQPRWQVLAQFAEKYPVVDIANSLIEKYGEEYTQVNIFGEVYGDNFRMNYDTNFENKGYRVFTVMLITNEDTRLTLSYEEMYALFADDLVPWVNKGALKDLIEMPVSEASLLNGRTSEGVVLQPYNGQRYTPSVPYLAVKCKTREFTENSGYVEKDAFHGNELLREMAQMVDSVRIENMVSKGYELTRDNIWEVLGALRDEITQEIYEFEDIKEKYSWEELYEETKKISKYIYIAVDNYLKGV